MQRGVTFEAALAFFWIMKSTYMGIQTDTAIRVLDINWPQIRRMRWEERPFSRPKSVLAAPIADDTFEYVIPKPKKAMLDRDEKTWWWLAYTFDPYENALYLTLEVRNPL